MTAVKQIERATLRGATTSALFGIQMKCEQKNMAALVMIQVWVVYRTKTLIETLDGCVPLPTTLKVALSGIL